MLRIPSVTQDDLNAFHSRVFGSPLPSSQLTPAELKSENEGVQQETHEEEDDDDLGYYPDGNKRTLTDAQIAMFRHSEIYSILRERQVLKENNEADGYEQRDDSISSAASEALKSHEAEIPEENEGAHTDQQLDSHDTLTVIPEVLVRNIKRKQSFEDTGDRSGKASTRRLVRELDSVTANDQALDYGDEPARVVSSTHAHVRNLDSDAAIGDYDKMASVPGKKIWWPSIEGT